jgi:flagellin
MTRINTNVSSLNAQKTLARNQQSLNTSMTRLSTGLRINSGKDDPSGMIAAAIQSNDIASMKQAITNTQNGSQLIGTADSALGQITSLLSNIRSLVTQVGNTAVTDANQIAANQLQVDSALQAIDRISQVTKFQGQKILDGSLDFINDAQTLPQVSNLAITSANLGATGQLDVSVQVAAHATQADITTSSGEDQATARLTFASRVSIGGIDIIAKSNSEEFNNINVETSITDAADNVSYNATTKTLHIGVANGTTTWDTIKTFINTGTNAISKLFEAQGTAAGNVAVTTATMKQVSLDITAKAKGIAANDVAVSMNYAAGAATSAVYNEAAKKLIVTVSSTAGTAVTAAQIATAIGTTKLSDGVTQAFTAAAVAAGNVYGNSTADKVAIANTSASGYSNYSFSPETRANATLTLASGGQIAFGGGTAKTLVIKANSASTGPVNVQFVDVAANKGKESATYTAGSNTIPGTLVINMASGADTSAASTMTAIINAINATGAFVATDMNGTTKTVTDADFFNATDLPATKGFTTYKDSITVESLNTGANYNNMQVKFAMTNNLAAPVAAYDAGTNTFTIQVNNTTDPTKAFTLQQVADAISAVKGFAGSFVSSSVTGDATKQAGANVLIGGSIDGEVVTNTGNTGGDTLLDDLQFEIAGKNGTQVLKFKAGDGAQQVVAQVNSYADSTGVTATNDNGCVTFHSADYGSSGFVAINVQSEGANGTFKRSISDIRATGTDANATVNGIHANTDGNQLSINTASLGLSFSLQANTTGNFRFSITGGGAQFQLGPDVVSNQQMRIGIQSVNTSRLGGVNGTLYELYNGNDASLKNDPNKAAKIVDDATNAVTMLRGRLGAIQGLTMDTNQKTLEDMVQNMQTSLSLIQDTDFAAETANLTRAQILTQSGMSVLSIANQQPQQVLSLLPRG